MADSVLSVREILQNDVTQAERELERRRSLLAELDDFNGGPAESPDWLAFGKVVSDRSSIGERFATGLPTLDLKTDGGLYAGTVTIVQGKPGIGKTNLATQMALKLGTSCAVGALFADEGLPGAAVTIGQQLGFPRKALMHSDPEVCAEAVAAMEAQMPFFRFLKPSAPDAVVERLFEDLDRIAPAGMQRVALIDSAQVVRSRKINGKESRFDALARLLVTIHQLTQDARSICIVISQVNRGSYRSKNEDDRGDPMAAGYGTGGIEFMAHLLLHLDGSPTKAIPSVTLKAVKNRLSAEGPFQVPLTMDMPRKRFMEVDVLTENAEKEAEDVAGRFEREKAMLDLFARNNGLSTRALRELTGGRAALVDMTRSGLVRSGRLLFEEGGKGLPTTYWRPDLPRKA